MKLKKKQVKSHVALHKSGKVLEEKGDPVDFSSHRIQPPDGHVLVGLSKGITKNLGDFESARVDCWMSAVVPLEEGTEALDEMSELIDSVIDDELTAIAKALRRK